MNSARNKPEAESTSCAAAVGVGAGVFLCVLGAIRLGLRYLTGGLVGVEWPAHCEMRSLVHRGWAPWVASFAGNREPFLAHLRARAYDPVRWLLIELPPALGSSLSLALHLGGTAMAAAWLARTFRWGARRSAAFGTGMALVVTLGDFAGHGTAWAGAPWFFVAWVSARKIREESTGAGMFFLWAFSLVALVLSGEIQFVIWIAAIVLAEGLSGTRRERAARLLCGAVIAAGVSSPAWLAAWGESGWMMGRREAFLQSMMPSLGFAVVVFEAILLEKRRSRGERSTGGRFPRLEKTVPYLLGLEIGAVILLAAIAGRESFPAASGVSKLAAIGNDSGAVCIDRKLEFYSEYPYACESVMTAGGFSPMATAEVKSLQRELESGSATAARALGCAYWISDDERMEQDSERETIPGVQPLVAWRLRDVPPTVYLSKNPRRVADPMAALTALGPHAAASDVEAVVDDPLDRLPEGGGLPDGDGVQDLHSFVQVGRTSLQAAGRGGAVIGLRRAFSAGWHALQNGHRLPVVRIAGAQIGVVVPDVNLGQIILEYRPPGLVLGLVLAALGLIVWIAASFVFAQRGESKAAKN